MKSSKLRIAISAIVFIAISIGLIFNVNIGTLSGIGWQDISILCPLGALTTMIATKTILPRGIVSLLIFVVIVLLFGRVFCGWICPMGLIEAIKGFFRSPKKRKEMQAKKRQDILEVAEADLAAHGAAPAAAPASPKDGEASCTHNCAACGMHSPEKRPKFDGRHGILLGALLSTAIFGFPVFCLICPIGLSFAAVLMVWRLFAFGDATWGILFVFGVLIVEIFLLKKWCGRFCPLAALMNLVGRFNKTTKPVINESKCIESTTGNACSRCATACEHGINLRHLEFGEHDLADCTRCRACVDACPTHAISMPLLPKKQQSAAKDTAAPAAPAASADAAKPAKAEATED